MVSQRWQTAPLSWRWCWWCHLCRPLSVGESMGREPHSSLPSDPTPMLMPGGSCKRLSDLTPRRTGRWAKQTERGPRGYSIFRPYRHTVYKCKHPTEKSNSTFAWKKYFPEQIPFSQFGFFKLHFLLSTLKCHPVCAISIFILLKLFCWDKLFSAYIFKWWCDAFNGLLSPSRCSGWTWFLLL